MFKQFMTLKYVQIALAFLLAGYMGFVRRTTRWSVQGRDVIRPVKDSGEGFIACAWHSRFLLSTAGWTRMKQKPFVLISKSRDGNLVAFTAKFLRLGVIRGSRKAKFKDKEKRGAGALRDMVQTLKDGECIYMTPDGPRGPRMRMGEGPVRLAKLSGAPLIAYGLATQNNITFDSWDRFVLPLPFGKGQIIWAGPVNVNKNASEADVEAARLKLEKLLNDATQSCDKIMGNEIIMPADPKRKKRHS